MWISFIFSIFIRHYNSQTLNDLDCLAAFECSGQIISSYVSVYGYGYKSLSNSTITNVDRIYCYGAYGCYDSDNLETNSGPSTVLYAYGSNSAESIQRMKTDDARCYASNSCQNSQIENDIECSGDQSCAQSTINVSEQIIAPGAYSLFNSTIISAGDITIDLEGYYAAFGAKLYCQQDDECIINCFGNGCTQFYVQCDGVCTVNLNSDETVPPINETAMINISETPFCMIR